MFISCRNITFSYPESETPVITGLDLDIQGPGFFSLFGLSGAGKTTLARLLCELTTPSDGEIRKTGIRKALYCHNQERLPGWLSIGEHMERVTSRDRQGLFQELSGEFGLTPLLSHRFRTLSLGQKNRVNLLRYLVQDFDLLITDEALANVDEPLRHRILSLVKNRFPDRMIVYISHNVLEVAAFSRTVYVLSQTPLGSAVLSGIVIGLDLSTPPIKNEPVLQEKAFRIIQAASSWAPM